MLNDILFNLFIIVGLFNLVHFAMYLVGANIYDVNALINRRKAVKVRPGRPPLSARNPLVTVLIPAYNESKVIERSLRSAWNNTYQNIEIIVINDGSRDSTSLVVRRFIGEKSRGYNRRQSKIIRNGNGFIRTWVKGGSTKNRQVHLIEQKNSGKANALNNALNSKWVNGELVMTLDADSILSPNAIANTVKHFNSSDIAGLAANVRIIEEPTALGLLQRFEHLIAYRSKKFYSLTGSELIIGGVASTYRRSVLRKVGNYDDDTVTEDIGLSMKIAALGNKKYRLLYAADVLASTEGVTDYKTLLRQRYRWKLGNLQNVIKFQKMLFSIDKKYTKMLTFYRVPMAYLGEVLLMLEPIILAYVAYLSVKYLTVGLFLGAYMTITLYILLTVWPDEHLSLKAKFKSSLQAPLIYFVFYLMNSIQLISITRCLINYKQIFGKKKTDNTWVSPTRQGRAVASVS